MVSPRLLVSLLRKRGRVTVARQCLALKHQGSFLPESDERLLIFVHSFSNVCHSILRVARNYLNRSTLASRFVDAHVSVVFPQKLYREGAL